MSVSLEAPAVGLDSLTQIASALPPTPLRAAGLEAFRRSGIPTTRHEEWKYTSLRELAETSFVAASATDVAQLDLDAWLIADGPRIVLVDGQIAPEWCRLGIPGLDVRFGDRLTPTDRERIGSVAAIDATPFSALNAACHAEAVMIELARGAVIEPAIEILHVTIAGAEAVAAFPRLFILAHSEAEATIVETYATIGEGVTFTCAVTEGTVAANAHVEHVKVQRESEQALHIALTEIRQEGDSSLNTFSVTYGGKLTRNDLNIFLNGSNLHCRMDGVVVQNGGQVCDNHTRLDHAFPHCDSFEVYKHVLDDQAMAVFNGKIFVHLDAQKTDAKQTNQAILLSPSATMNSKPQLEIFADDVKCTHGATVGQLRSDALFYLRSRGIDETQARAILVYAFAAEVLEKIECEPVRNELERLLYEKLQA
ncbi:MAG TPA: Fe-S cluster assembly protein SufD [Fimbriimonadaceae bacterium]|nr:Fe-S cluster assembly protein SufD [Fimbriimonadaceae bacterium]